MSILVIGDVMLDRYIIGTVDRVSPEAPVPVVHIQEEKNCLGGAANVALNIAQLGHKPVLFGQIGNDSNGHLLKQEIAKHNIDFTFAEYSLPTITKIRIIGNHQQIVRYDYEQIADQPNTTLALKNNLRSNHYNIAVISDYKKGLCNEAVCQYLIQTINENDGKVIVDPKGANWSKYRGAYLITPNMKELGDIVGKTISNTDDAVSQEGEKIRKAFQMEHLLVTRSEKGMTLINDSGVFHFPTEAQSVYDVTGAGDTVIATLTTSLFNGYTLIDAIQRANYAAGIAVSHFGTYAVSLKDLQQKEIVKVS